MSSSDDEMPIVTRRRDRRLDVTRVDKKDLEVIKRIANAIRNGCTLYAACRLEGKDPDRIRHAMNRVEAGQGTLWQKRYAKILQKAEADLEAELVSIAMDLARNSGVRGANTLRFLLERRFHDAWGPKYKLEHSVAKSQDEIAQMSDAELEALIANAKR